MKIVKQLEFYARIFFTVLGFTFISVSVFLYIFKINPIDTSLLWQVMLFAFLSTLFCCIYYMDVVFLKIHLYTKVSIHFTLIAGTLFLFAYFFRWIRFDNVRQLVMIILLTFAMYAACFILISLNDFFQAKQLNVKLDEYKRKRGKLDE